MLCGVDRGLEVLQLPQGTKSPVKFLGCLLQQTLILLFVGLWWAVNVDNLVDDLGCRWGVYLMIWTWRTAWDVIERGELGRNEMSC